MKVGESNKTWDDFCMKIPVIDVSTLLGIGPSQSDIDPFASDDDNAFAGFEDEVDDIVGETDPSVELGYPKPFCNMVERLPRACFENNILELWAMNGNYSHISDEAIETLTKDDILFKINKDHFT